MADEGDILGRLDPDFRDKLKAVAQGVQQRGFRIVAYDGLRDPWTQAIYWRQSRTRDQVVAKIEFLREKGAPFIAEILESVGPQTGKPVTDVVPGMSFHQYGRAADVYVVSPQSRRALWYEEAKDGAEYDLAVELYAKYGQVAKAQGLVWGGDWSSPFDPGHVQGQKQRTPLQEYGGYPQVDAEMRRRWEKLTTS